MTATRKLCWQKPSSMALFSTTLSARWNRRTFRGSNTIVASHVRGKVTNGNGHTTWPKTMLPGIVWNLPSFRGGEWAAGVWGARCHWFVSEERLYITGEPPNVCAPCSLALTAILFLAMALVWTDTPSRRFVFVCTPRPVASWRCQCQWGGLWCWVSR